MENKPDFLDSLINRLGNEQMPMVENETEFVDSIIDNLPNKLPIAKPSSNNVLALSVVRYVSSIAAVFFIGLIIGLNINTKSKDKTVAIDNTSTEMYCESCTPMELYSNYVDNNKLRQERMKKIEQLKSFFYENN